MNQKLKNKISNAFSSSLLLLPLAAFAGDNKHPESQFTVKENGNKIEITSPWGVKSYETEFTLGAMRHYKIEIPIEDLRPAMAPEQEPPGTGRDIASTPKDAANTTSTAPSACETNSKIEIKNMDADGNRKPSSIPDSDSDYDGTDRLLIEANHLYNRGRFYEASVYVEELIRKNPIFVRAWVMKGSLLYMQGYTDLAKKAWAKAGELDPNDPQVRDLQKRYP